MIWSNKNNNCPNVHLSIVQIANILDPGSCTLDKKCMRHHFSLRITWYSIICSYGCILFSKLYITPARESGAVEKVFTRPFLPVNTERSGHTSRLPALDPNPSFQTPNGDKLQTPCTFIPRLSMISLTPAFVRHRSSYQMPARRSGIRSLEPSPRMMPSRS